MTLMVRLAIRARRAKMRPNAMAIVGLIGRAETSIAPNGTVFVRGELWRARSTMNVSRGANVRVTGIEGLTLDVEAEMQADPKNDSAPTLIDSDLRRSTTFARVNKQLE